MLPLLLSTVALASSVTELPPMLRGDVSIGYAWESLRGSLRETAPGGDVEVGQRVVTEHILRYRADFTAGPGVGAYVEVPQWASQTVSGTDGNTMVYDPATRTGTLIGTNPVADGEYASGGGVGGVWLGVRGTPWSEAFGSRNNVTWMLDAAVRTPDSSNFWSGKERGAGPGGLGWRLHSAFSHTRGDSSPYFAVTWTQNRALEVDTFAADGTALGTAVAVDPADTLRLRIGTENVASRQTTSGAELRFDLHATVDYAGPAVVPSGIYLPSVLDTTAGAAVQQAEQLRAGAGLGVHWRPMRYMELRFFADAASQIPQRQEHPYPIRTGFDTLAASAGTELRVRIR